MSSGKRPVVTVVAVPTLAEVRAIAADSANIKTVIPSVNAKARSRGITRQQIELCCKKGTFEEGPFPNERGDWQVTIFRHAAGQEMRVVVVVKDGVLIVRSNH